LYVNLLEAVHDDAPESEIKLAVRNILDPKSDRLREQAR
jgi:hypothetical protein